jgi:hypothetical protein
MPWQQEPVWIAAPRRVIVLQPYGSLFLRGGARLRGCTAGSRNGIEGVGRDPPPPRPHRPGKRRSWTSSTATRYRSPGRLEARDRVRERADPRATGGHRDQAVLALSDHELPEATRRALWSRLVAVGATFLLAIEAHSFGGLRPGGSNRAGRCCQVRERQRTLRQIERRLPALSQAIEQVWGVELWSYRRSGGPQTFRSSSSFLKTRSGSSARATRSSYSLAESCTASPPTVTTREARSISRSRTARRG